MRLIRAPEYPHRPVQLLVPFPPGGSTAFTAAHVAGALSAALGQPFIVEHRTGEFGLVALRELAEADEYTLLIGSVITNSITPVVYRKRMPFDYEAAIAPVSRLVEFPSFLITRASVPARTVGEFIEYARRTWGRVRNGTDWIGSFTDMDAVILGKRAGLEVINVEKPGGANELVNAVAEGEIDMFFVNARTGSLAVKEGRVKALAVTGRSRARSLPDVPTMEESGFPGIGTPHWHGLFAGRRAPGAVIQLVHQAVVGVLNADRMRAVFEESGARVTPSASPEQFAAEIRAEMAGWEAVIADINLSVE